MSDLERRGTIKRRRPKVKNSKAHPSNIPPTNQTPPQALPPVQLSTVGKEGDSVKSLVDPSLLKDALGTDDRHAGMLLLSQTVLAMPSLHLNGKVQIQQCVSAGMAILRNIGPRDELEGVLAVQMSAVHNLAMDCMSQASRSAGSPEFVEAKLNQANKLMRTFTAQMEALNRHRGNANQHMVVRDVTVNEGGQAIVGPVNHQGLGPVSRENEK
jgi:hypothetical protein